MVGTYVVLSSTPTSSSPRQILTFQSAKNDDDYSSIAEVDAILLVAGDPASEDEPMRKGTCLQVRYETSV